MAKRNDHLSDNAAYNFFIRNLKIASKWFKSIEWMLLHLGQYNGALFSSILSLSLSLSLSLTHTRISVCVCVFNTLCLCGSNTFSLPHFYFLLL